MPQGQRKPSFEELLAGAPPAPSPTPGPSFEELLLQAPQQPPAQPQGPQPGLLERFRRNVGIAAEQGYVALKGKGAALAEIAGGIATGDFRPAIEAGQNIVRGAAPIVGALGRPDAGPRFIAESIAQAGPLAEIQARQDARRLASGDTSFQQRAQRQAELQAQGQAFDPSLGGRLTRGVVREGIKLLPAVAAGVASGGSVPAIAAATAASSFDEPENLVTSTALAALPVPSARAIKSAISPAIERLLGRGAAQIAEAEAGQAGGALVRTGAVANMEAMRSAGLQTAIAEAAKEVPESLTRRIAGEISAFPRAMMSSLDISAPGRQGLLLSASPSRWGAAIKAGGRMFQAFKPRHYQRITNEIRNHPDAAVADDAGLYLAFKQGEELFSSRLANKVPGVAASQRGYETYLDSLRMDVFSKYRKVIDAQGLAPEAAQRAYKAAAQAVNVFSGRGSAGERFDKAVPFLSQILFAPRYTISRFQALNPVMYYRNFRDPATRPVGKQQMKDLVSYLSLVATTYGMARAAGFDVGLDPNEGDFLKIRAGQRTFDPGAGLVQIARFAIRAGSDLFRRTKGEKSGYGEDAGSLTTRFIRSKLAPVPSYAADFFSGRTYEGKKFDARQAGLGIVERSTPLAWGDFVEALYSEGAGGAAATLPGFVGIGVQSYDQPGGFLDTAAPLLREYTRANRQLPEIRRVKGEGDQQFNARLKVFGEALSTYGTQLVESQEYRNADAATKDRALNLLPRRISSALIKQNEAWQLQPRVIMSDVRENMQNPRR